MNKFRAYYIFIILFMLFMAYLTVCILDLQCTPKIEPWNIFRIMKGVN